MKIEKKSTNQHSLFTEENVTRFNNAYAKTNDPKYLDFYINEFIKIENITLNEIIVFTEILKTAGLLLYQFSKVCGRGKR